jgi:RNA polymerase sigma-70 factor (ECF subfamily)
MNMSISFDEESVSGGVVTCVSDSVMPQSPEQIAESECSQQFIRRAIESLPVEFREVAVLRELEELTYEEIGLVLGIPKGTVMSRLARARIRLRELLADLNEQGKS